ncbi:hypothetical protein NA57DRAFT_53125 [Rhizodiscina lignyota]|uniref:Uncharacterized protein n=1 Tax=Rhizodiscina lignyota TaxID=1504668 RepID=A0A9P4IL99_9PEZI|nr:hypothetical protein NA57DRAFT_53125 [Rhizodiscina lignyota]
MRSLLFILPALVAGSTNIATFSDSNCQQSFQNLQGPNGYPNGTCTALNTQGSYGSFQVVDEDPGCTVTIYGKDATPDSCSSTSLQFAEIAMCYNASWVYYSIDACLRPGTAAYSSALSASSAASTSSAAAATSSSSSSTSHSSHSSPIGPIVGGVVGGVLVGMLVLGGGFFLLRRRRTQKQQERSSRDYHEMPGSQGWIPHRDAKVKDTAQAQELPANQVGELPGDMGFSPRSELETPTTGMERDFDKSQHQFESQTQYEPVELDGHSQIEMQPLDRDRK